MSYGKLSTIFGPEFAGQDQYARQVRMPMPPLLLAEEVLGVDGEPKSMASKATMWTASLIPDYLWCLHHGRLPAFLGLEVGQADLLLISWLGVDFENKGQRMYRLLGCDVIFNGMIWQGQGSASCAIFILMAMPRQVPCVSSFFTPMRGSIKNVRSLP